LRNVNLKRWIPRIEALVGGEKDAIVIVGAAHLAGKQSVVEMLEKDLQVPVVHATLAEAWTIHKRLAVRETKPGHGRLLAELP